MRMSTTTLWVAYRADDLSTLECVFTEQAEAVKATETLNAGMADKPAWMKRYVAKRLHEAFFDIRSDAESNGRSGQSNW